LEEADILSDRLAIMDNGKIVASGTPRELKAQIAGDSIAIKPQKGRAWLDGITDLLRGQAFVNEVRVEGDVVRLYVNDGPGALPKVMKVLDGRDIKLDSLALAQPSLDDVFLKQTGRTLRDSHLEGARA
jgi:ABC-2 type transport system ATP-binding protein